MAQHAPGFYTASTIAPFLTGKGEELLKGGVTAAVRIAMERCGKIQLVNSVWEGNKYTEWGNEHEHEAIRRYEELSFVSVTDQQVGVRVDWMSCTPDGYVGKDGLVEIKCPFMEHVHFDYLLDPETLNAEYYDQVQFQLMLTSRKWCDLVSYHPHFDDPLDIVVSRIEPNEQWQQRTRTRLQQAEKIVQDVLDTINQKG